MDINSTRFRRATDKQRIAMRALIIRAVKAWPQFDTPHDQVSGAALVEWFADWREDAKKLLESSK